jgi:hypothetical protein
LFRAQEHGREAWPRQSTARPAPWHRHLCRTVTSSPLLTGRATRRRWATWRRRELTEPPVPIRPARSDPSGAGFRLVAVPRDIMPGSSTGGEPKSRPVHRDRRPARMRVVPAPDNRGSCDRSLGLHAGVAPVGTIGGSVRRVSVHRSLQWSGLCPARGSVVYPRSVWERIRVSCGARMGRLNRLKGVPVEDLASSRSAGVTGLTGRARTRSQLGARPPPDLTPRWGFTASDCRYPHWGYTRFLVGRSRSPRRLACAAKSKHVTGSASYDIFLTTSTSCRSSRLNR